MVNEVPDPRDEPPVDAANQFIVPDAEVAPSTTTPASHRDPGTVEVTGGVIFTVAKTAVLVEVQPLLVAST